MRLSDLRKNCISVLKESATETPELDTDLIISYFLSKERTWIMFHRDFEVSAENIQKINYAIVMRAKGLPVAYITGNKEFYGYDFYVNQNVLIPKPDTELLVDLALNSLAKTYSTLEDSSGDLKRIPEICDMCCGSGCVGISVLKTLMENDGISVNSLPKMTFVDISSKALAVVSKNAERLLGAGETYSNFPDLSSALSRTRIIHSNLFENVPFTFDLILSNPPYIPHSEAISLLSDGRSEPILALDGDVASNGEYSGTEDGLALIRRLVPQCYDRLSRGGLLIMECGEYNAQGAAGLFEQSGFRNVHIERDLSGMLRDVCGEKC